MDALFANFSASPLVAFTILLLVILVIPPIFERLKLPGLVGLLVAGLILGQDGLGLINAESETMKLLADIGKIYLMFVAGLEIDLAEFRKTRNRSLVFGLATFLLPLGMGILVGRAVGLGPNAAVLIGSLLASHTLLGYPIVNRLGVLRNQAITVTIGATIFTDIAALLVLAICVSVHSGEFSAASLAQQLLSLAIYAAIVLFGFNGAGRAFFRRSGGDEGNQFLFVLLAVFLAAVGAQLIHVDQIVGAFLAGLAVNDVVGRSPVEEKVEFVGSTLFIPFFFVDMGLLLNVSGLVEAFTTEGLLTLLIVLGLFLAKFLAAAIAKLCYRYTWFETLTMWSLSLPQVAATLAAALVGVRAEVIPATVFNAVIVLMLVTAIAGPVLTSRFARQLSVPPPPLPPPGAGIGRSLPTPDSFKVVVPIHQSYPQKYQYLVEMGALLARHEQGIVIPLTIAKATVPLDEPQLTATLEQGDRLLTQAQTLIETFAVAAQPQVRIDDDVAQGISRTAREQQASLILMGWSPTINLTALLLGSILDKVFWSAHCPVAVLRLLEDPAEIRRILVPIKLLSKHTFQNIRTVQVFADTHDVSVTYLHVCDRQTPPAAIAQLKANLTQYLNSLGLEVAYRIVVVRHHDIAKVILRLAHAYDLVVLQAVRRRTAGGLAVSDVTTKVIAGLKGSVMLFGEPHRATDEIYIELPLPPTTDSPPA